MKTLSVHGKMHAGRRPKSLRVDTDTRAAILNAAQSVFARRGFEGTSIREVAETAGVNNAMIYYHFKDKQELYQAVLADSFAAWDRIWEHEIFTSGAPTREKIGKYVEELIRFQHVNEDLRRILSMELACCSKSSKWLAENLFSHSYQKLSDILKQGIRSGEIKKIDVQTAVATLTGMIIHSFILRPLAYYVTGKDLDLSVSRFGAFVTDLFFEGLNAHGKPVAR